MKGRGHAAWLALACIATLLLALGGYSDSSAQNIAQSTPSTAQPRAERWYAPAQVARGAAVSSGHCASCHGKAGEGAAGWQGSALPPPLNGTGHAWHHPFGALGYQIKFGTPGGQGKMPSFASVLKDDDIIDVIAWFQSQWPDDIYSAWLRIEAKARRAKQ